MKLILTVDYIWVLSKRDFYPFQNWLKSERLEISTFLVGGVLTLNNDRSIILFSSVHQICFDYLKTIKGYTWKHIFASYLKLWATKREIEVLNWPFLSIVTALSILEDKRTPIMTCFLIFVSWSLLYDLLYYLLVALLSEVTR